MYVEGDYFSNPIRHDEDATYKAKALFNVIEKYINNNPLIITSYADIGCGSGKIVKLLSDKLININHPLDKIYGYDVSPHVNNLKDEKIIYKHADFLNESSTFDLVTLNDVFEHVPDPISFLKNIGSKSKYVLMHIPLEDSFLVNYRNLQNKKIKDPGHLIFLNKNSALNLISFAGMQIVEYDWSYATINAPSNRTTILQKIIFPLKKIVIKINPYLYSKIFGFSLVVLAKGSINIKN